MIDDKYIDLIDKDISGEINPPEREMLHTHLFHNYEAQKFYNELFQASALLKKVPRIVPPNNLKHRIMCSLDFLTIS